MYKKDIIYFTLFLVFFFCTAQVNGGTFLAQGTAWVDGFGYEQDGHYKLDDVKLFYYTTAGDTLIDDKTYFRIRCTKRCMTSYKLDVDAERNEYVREKSLFTDDGNLYFFMREDESGDVWFYTEDKEIFEEISHNSLYNDINVADALICRDLFLEINLIDGKTYKRYNKNFLEGIGPLDGPLIGIGRSNSLNADVNQLFALYKNGQLVYRNEGYLSALEEQFPNILDNLTGEKPNDIEDVHRSKADTSNAIYDLSGRKVNSQSSIFNGLKKGIYIQNGKKVALK